MASTYVFNPLLEYGFDETNNTPPIPPTGGGGVTWSAVSGTSATGEDGLAFLFENAALSTVSLPTSTTFGNLMEFSSIGGGFRITQNAGQKIIFGQTETTVGTSGYLESLEKGSTIRLLSIGSNRWLCVYSTGGSFTLV